MITNSYYAGCLPDSMGCRQVRDELKIESLQFVKEQRIRCLSRGEWFPINTDGEARSGRKTRGGDDSATTYTEGTRDAKKSSADPYLNWRFVKLSHNRRYLHYADFESETGISPTLEELTEKSKLPNQFTI